MIALRLAVWAILAALAAPAPAPRRHVLLVSIDGLSWPHLQRELPKLPTLSRLWSMGVRGPLESVFPSLTWPAHTSLVTGVLPQHHGVLGNRVVDRGNGEVLEAWNLAKSVHVQTLWDLAAARGLSVAAVLWPATGGANAIHWNLPEVYGQQVFAQQSSPGLLAELAAAGIPTNALFRLGNEEMFLLDSFDRDVAVLLAEQHKPDLMLLHFVGVDTLQHSWGPQARQADWALETIDRYLGDVLAAYARAGLAAQTTVIVVSDHGFLATEHYADPQEILTALVGAPLARKFTWAINGQVLYLYTQDAKALTALPKLLREVNRQPELASALGPHELAAQGWPTAERDAHAPDAMLVAKPEYFWVQGRGRHFHGPMLLHGMHGIAPGRPELQGIFVAAGPGLHSAADVAGLRIVDVAPLVARLLGLTLPPLQDGRWRAELAPTAEPTAAR